MKTLIFKIFIILVLTASGVIWNGNFQSNGDGFIAKAEARRGRPASPVSYAGVARRSTVGVGAPGVGAGAPGVGVTPGVGAGAPGVGVAPGNAGGPVNRVGVR
jgi:hypothetical protein